MTQKNLLSRAIPIPSPSPVQQDTVDGIPSSKQPVVSVQGVTRTFKGGSVVALRGVSLEVAFGQFVTILGPSGCGKTTLLRMINGLLHPDEGMITVNGHRPKPNAEMAMVFQQPRLLPWLTAAKNVGLPLRVTGVPAPERDRRVLDALALIELPHCADMYPHELSGGMQQRIGVARALAMQPSVLLLDEPFGALDAISRHEIRTSFMRIVERLSVTVVLITHDIDEAVLMSDKIVVLGGSPGTVKRELDVDLGEISRSDPAVVTSPSFAGIRNQLRQIVHDRGKGKETIE